MISDYYGTYLQSYTWPLDSSITELKPRKQITIGLARAITPPVYDGTDGFALVVVGRNLTLVRLRDLQVMDSISAIQGTRKIASSVVYNHRNNRATLFITKVKSTLKGPVYNLEAQEYRVRRNKLVSTNSTFKNMDPVKGPWARSVLSAGNLDHRTRRIWCLDTPNRRLVSFLAADLSSPAKQIILPVNSSFFGYSNNVAYDFDSQRAYVVSDLFDGFVVHSIDLRTEKVRESIEYKTNKPAATVHLDGVRRNLYVGLQGDEFDWLRPRNVKSANPTLAIVSVESYSLDTVPLIPVPLNNRELLV